MSKRRKEAQDGQASLLSLFGAEEDEVRTAEVERVTQVRIAEVPEAAAESSALLRGYLLKRGINVPRAVALTGFPRDYITAWTHLTEPATIPPEHMKAVMDGLGLDDDEVEALLYCSLQEHRPFWSFDDVEVTHGCEQTLEEVASALDFTRQRCNQIEHEAMDKLRPLVLDLGLDGFAGDVFGGGGSSLWRRGDE